MYFEDWGGFGCEFKCTLRSHLETFDGIQLSAKLTSPLHEGPSVVGKLKRGLDMVMVGVLLVVV